MLMFSHAFRSGWPALRDPGRRGRRCSGSFRGLSSSRRSAAAWPPRSRWWAASGDPSPGPSSVTCSRCCWRAGSPLPEALRLTGEGVQNDDLDRACQAMAADVERGSDLLPEAMAGRPELPTGLARLLRWATDQNAIAEILHMAGEMFEARARGQATFAGTVMAVLAVDRRALGHLHRRSSA